MGNGPSLKKLIEFGFDNIPDDIYTVGLNAAYRYFDEIGWYPNCIGSFDPKITKGFLPGMLEMVKKEECTTEKILTLVSDGRSINPFLTQEILAGPIIPELDARINHLWLNPTWYNHNTGSCTSGHNAAKFLLQEGYDIIYLIGMDNNYIDNVNLKVSHKLISSLWDSDTTSKGNKFLDKTPEKNPNYFTDDYQKKGDILNYPGSDRANENGNITWKELYDNLKMNDKLKDHRIVNLSDISNVPFFEFSTIEKEFNKK